MGHDENAAELSLGQRIRQLRKQRGITLLELSRNIDVTESFVSQIERGVANPSMVTLRRIAENLGVDMAALFTGGADDGRMVRAGNRRRMVHPAGLLEDSILTPPAAKALQVHYSMIAEGHGSEEQYTHAADEECVIVLTGQLDVSVEDESHHLEGGDALLLEPKRPHGYHNPGPGDTTAIWVMSPAVY